MHVSINVWFLKICFYFSLLLIKLLYIRLRVTSLSFTYSFAFAFISSIILMRASECMADWFGSVTLPAGTSSE